MYSVKAFAQKKGISQARVRHLISAGEIPSERSGSSVLIPGHAVSWRPRSRRPLSERMASALLDKLAGIEPDVSPREMLRVRAHVRLIRGAEDPALLLADLIRCGPYQRFNAHEVDIEDLKRDPRISLSGAHVPDFGLSPGSILHAHADPEALNSLVADYLLTRSASGNVHLCPKRVKPEHRLALAVVDLAEIGGGRELREANRVARAITEKASG